MRKRCQLCPDLVKSRKKVCWGTRYTTGDHDNTRVMVLAESPGYQEDNAGTPLIGPSGQEARHHLDINGISRHGVWLDNVIKCHPTGDRNPTVEEVETCTTTHLIPKIWEICPQYVITMGRFSTRLFLGDVDMEMVHGIPHETTFHGYPCVVIPSYHPAAGMHSPETMIMYHADMVVAGKVIKGEVPTTPPVDRYKGKEKYKLIKSISEVPHVWKYPGIITVDTEWAKGGPWCLSFSTYPGSAYVIMADNKTALTAFNAMVSDPETTTIIHNAAYDLPVLDQMGVHPAKIADTMVMAYLLQNEPQGLKPLAFRHCGMEMKTYKEMVGTATQVKAIKYLMAVSWRKGGWPKPDPVLEWRKGEPHVRQPQNISVKVRKVLNALGDGKDVDAYDRWRKMEGTEVVEKVLGRLDEADLSDIPVEDAVRYAARDADATLRVYPGLWERITSLGLEDTFWRDMRAMPMVVDMQSNGMPCDRKSFQKLSDYFQEKMDEIRERIQHSVGHLMEGRQVNPGSYPQSSELIYDKLRLHEKGGRHKSRKGAVQRSTAEDILKRYVGLHPVVQEIMDWRGYQKLKGTYSDAIPKLMEEDDRVRATVRMTRTATGRLSTSTPNLMAQPVRSEEGRKVRDCYRAGPGRVFLSGDYSQVEMRCAAHVSQDPAMIDVFLSGEDLHSKTASAMFGIPMDQLDEMRHRYPAKRVGFGILYLITTEGLFRELTVAGVPISLDDCREMIESWFEIYHGVSAFMKENGAFAKRYGYVKDMWGRRRYIPNIRSTHKWSRLEAERQAGNAPIQMGAQGVIKEAMGRLVPVYREMGIKPLLQIHDDIVWEVEEDMVETSAAVIKAVMEDSTPKDFTIPLEVDFKYGKRWGSMSHLQFE